VEGLEGRCLLAAGPVIQSIGVPLNIPVGGKTLVVPVTAVDPAGGAVTFTLTSSDPNVTVTAEPVSATNPILQITTSFGVMEFELFGDLTPNTVNMIAGMAKSGFYNGLTFHRIISNFVIQGGDPAGNGTGGPGFTFDDEFNPSLIYSGTGQLAMANTAPDTNGSQFFVTVGPQRGLDFNNAIFGQMVRGFDVLAKINAASPPVTMTNVAIIQDPTVECFILKTGSGATVNENASLTLTATSASGSTNETLQAKVVADNDQGGTPVNDPPTLDPVSNQVSTTSSPITFHVTRTDLENDASTFKVAVAAADQAHATVSEQNVTNSGEDIVVTPLGGFTGVVHLTIGVEETGATHRGNTQLDNTNPFSLFDTQNITVAFGDQALTAGTAPSFTATEGAATTGGALGSFTDADTATAASAFSVTVNWGDGVQDTNAQVSGSAGNFTVTGTHTYKEAGKFGVKVTITDSSGATTILNGTATVADAALTGQGGTLSGFQLTALSGTVATFTDANASAEANDFTALINWGDNTPATVGVVSGSGGHFTVTGSHTFAAPGTFTPKVTITDVNTAGDATPATATPTGTAVVSPASAHQRFVNDVFNAILGRNAENAALTYFGTVLDLGIASPFQVILAVVNSPEHWLGVVNQTYDQFIDRLPDPVTQAYLVNYLAMGGTKAGLEVVLANTPEYFLVHGGGSNTGFVQSLFQDGLNRTAEAAAVSQLTALLDKGMSRDKVAAMVFSSPEAQLDMIQTQFQTFLKRAPDAFGQNGFTHLLQQDGMHDELMAALIGSSPEFLAQV
jgi:cyclophilin family peptidyl-prolyl cis-trans isomerase